MKENIIVGFRGPSKKNSVRYNQKLITSPIMVITSPYEETVRKCIAEYNIKDFDFNSATYGLYSNIRIELNNETGECKIQVFDENTGELKALYKGVTNNEQ